MSKSFLTTVQAYSKLGLAGGSNNWIRKSELEATGKCDMTKLVEYRSHDFVVEDDIIQQVSGQWKTIYSFSGISDDDNPQTLLQPFDSSKSFRITGDISWNSIVWNCGKAVVLYKDVETSQIVVMQVFNYNTADKFPYVNVNVRSADGVWSVFNSYSFSMGTKYTFYIYYNAVDKTIHVKFGAIDERRPISIKEQISSKLMLTGSPEWSNGSCRCTFSSLKIELYTD